MHNSAFNILSLYIPSMYMKIVFRLLAVAILLMGITPSFAQIDPKQITIVRDSFGVPHIFAKTDAEVAYGLAWAHCEDDFKDIQYNLLSGQKRLGSVMGKEGVLFDYGMQFLGIDTFVDNNFEKDLSPKFRTVLDAYISGVNAYAQAHPDEVLIKKAIPFTSKDAVKGYCLNLSLWAGAGLALKSIKENRIEEFNAPNETGSNAMAIAPTHTEDGKAWLAINSHQPIEGRFAWYEAHLCSEEGWDIIGGLFPGGMSIFVGTNRHLGWAHTTDYHTWGDIYKLNMKGKKYQYEDEWRDFKTGKAKLHVNLKGFKISLNKKLYFSEYGPVFKAKHGFYAIRFPAYRDMRACEQWYNMNKATNFKEFETAVKMQGIPLFNIVYADVTGNIYLHSGGIFPDRNPTLNWHQPITSASSRYNWKGLLPYDKKVTLFNPSCGYVFNCNNTPTHATGAECNWKGDFPGLQKFMYNRGERFEELLAANKGKFTWEYFRMVKFDKSYSKTGCYADRFKTVFNLDAAKYPNIADAIAKLKKWNYDGAANNREAALAMIIQEHLRKKSKAPFAFLMIRKQPIPEADAVWAIGKAKKHLVKHFGSIDVSLGTVQRLIRGNVSLPASGLREVSRATDAKLYNKKTGIYKAESGDGYIQLVRFGKDGPEIESINAYGASHNPASKHYTDQMEMFEKEQLKPMTFDKATIIKNAERVYHPGIGNL
jgi:acyl-homoserine-lactone acylase